MLRVLMVAGAFMVAAFSVVVAGWVGVVGNLAAKYSASSEPSSLVVLLGFIVSFDAVMVVPLRLGDAVAGQAGRGKTKTLT
jgi:hypothetical protein